MTSCYLSVPSQPYSHLINTTLQIDVDMLWWHWLLDAHDPHATVEKPDLFKRVISVYYKVVKYTFKYYSY